MPTKTRTQPKKKVPVPAPTVKAPVRQLKPRTSHGVLPTESSAPAPTIDISPPLPQDVQQALTLANQARALVITNSETYIQAGNLLKDVVAIRKSITDRHEKIKKATDFAHKMACEDERKDLAPVMEAEQILRQAVGFYSTEQTRLDNERRRKAQEADDEKRRQDTERARIEAEEKSAAEVERLVLYEGFTLEDAMMRVNPQARVQQAVESVPVARTVVQSTLPKVQGMPTVAPTYKVDVYDLKELCGAVYRGEYSTECVLPNMPTLNSLARTLKEGFKMPGCRLDKGETVTVR